MGQHCFFIEMEQMKICYWTVLPADRQTGEYFWVSRNTPVTVNKLYFDFRSVHREQLTECVFLTDHLARIPALAWRT